MQIGVIGSENPEPTVLKMAAAVGREIAKNGHILICGGRGGIMEAAARGAKEYNGLTVGILPSADGTDANKYIDIKIRTGMGFARNIIVVLSSDVIIAIEGGCGTLSEIGLAWAHGKKIVALKSSGGWAERLAGEKIDNRRDDYILTAKTPKEAVKLALMI